MTSRGTRGWAAMSTSQKPGGVAVSLISRLPGGMAASPTNREAGGGEDLYQTLCNQEPHLHQSRGETREGKYKVTPRWIRGVDRLDQGFPNSFLEGCSPAGSGV